MGTLTAAQMGTQIRLALGGRSATQVPDSTIWTWLTMTQRHLGHPAVYEHETLRSSQDITLTSASVYNLTAGTTVVRGVFNDTTGYSLIPKPQNYIDGMSSMTSGGRPIFYHSSGTSAGRTLELWPAPSVPYQGDTVTVRTYIEPVAIDANADVSAFDSIWDEPMIYGAVYRGWIFLGQPIQRDLALEAYSGAINEIKGTLDMESREDRERSPEYDTNTQRYQR